MSDTVFLVFPHQLFKSLFTVPKSIPFCFIEDEHYFRHIPFHKHKLILHRASMQAIRERLLVKGFQVSYFDTLHAPTLEGVFAELKKQRIRTVRYYEVIDADLEKRLAVMFKKFEITPEVLRTPAFLVATEDLELEKKTKKKLNFASFYRDQRKKLQLLTEHGKPLGGEWMPKAFPPTPIPLGHEIPAIHVSDYNRYVEEAMVYVDKNFADNEGESETFVFPVTYADSEDWLEDFIRHRLHAYAEYQHTLSAEEGILYHAALTPLLNVGLLTPQQVVEAVQVYSRHHSIPFRSHEAFLRQIVGWREYLRALYVTNQGKLGLTEAKKIPAAVLNISTGIVPVDIILQRIRMLAYCQPAEQHLMVRSFLKLLGVGTKEIYTWTMTRFIDAYDWWLLPYLGLSDKEYEEIFSEDFTAKPDYVEKAGDFPAGPWIKKWQALFSK